MLRAIRSASLSLALVVLPTVILSADDGIQTGVHLLDPDQYGRIPSIPPTIYFPGLPDHWDLSDRFPQPQSQGKQQSCAAWAVGYAVKSYQEKRERNWSYSPDHVFSPAFIYNRLNRDPSCQGRIELTDALEMVTIEGIPTLNIFPYTEDDCTRQPTDSVMQAAGRFYAAGFRRVNFKDRGEVKRLLVQGYPVIIAMMVGKDFENLSADKIYSSLNLNSLELDAHALVVVGYDNQKQAFRVMNSWGVTWADKGFGWISFDAFREWAREAYVLYDAIADEPGTLVEVVIREEVSLGAKTATRSTGDHHCWSNCEGEPTRTNYQMTIEADPGNSLRNVRLTCVSGPCHGWNQILFSHIEDGGHRAVASWDTWSHPTTWQLTADQYRLKEVARIPERVGLGKTFDIQLLAGIPAPLVETTGPEGQRLTFEAGTQKSNAFLEEIGKSKLEDATLITYRILSRKQKGPPQKGPAR